MGQVCGWDTVGQECVGGCGGGGAGGDRCVGDRVGQVCGGQGVWGQAGTGVWGQAGTGVWGTGWGGVGGQAGTGVTESGGSTWAGPAGHWWGGMHVGVSVWLCRVRSAEELCAREGWALARLYTRRETEAERGRERGGRVSMYPYGFPCVSLCVYPSPVYPCVSIQAYPKMTSPVCPYVSVSI